MTHLEMKRFKERLIAENAIRLSEGRSMIEPFFPYDFLKEHHVTKEDTQESGKQTEPRAKDFVHYVFLKTTKSDIESLVNAPWNRPSHIRLRHYYDAEGKQATVSDRMMDDFFEACLHYSGQLEVTFPIKGIEAMDKVKIKTGPFAGQVASVVQVQHSKGGDIQLELAIEVVSGIINLRMSHVTRNQISILDRSSVDTIREDFIEYTQNHLLAILEHRIKRVKDEDVNKQDAIMLTRLIRYRNHRVETPAARNHFLALMLICAHLCRSANEQELTLQVQECLAEMNRRSESKAATDTRTYLWIALYIATREPEYRDAAKQYIRDYQPKSAKLRRFVALIRTGRKV